MHGPAVTSAAGVTRWPRPSASRAMAAPVRPVKMLVRQRTWSMKMRVLPAVTRRFMLFILHGVSLIGGAGFGGTEARQVLFESAIQVREHFFEARPQGAGLIDLWCLSGGLGDARTSACGFSSSKIMRVFDSLSS